jgi:hypothetical protein
MATPASELPSMSVLALQHRLLELAALAPPPEQLSHDLPRWCGLAEDTSTSQALRAERKTRGLPIAA